MGMKKEF